jgi:hypothetical protein
MRIHPRPAQVLLVSIGLAATGSCPTREVIIPDSRGNGSVVTWAAGTFSDKSGFPCVGDTPELEVIQAPQGRSGGIMYVGFRNRSESKDWGVWTCWWWKSNQYRGFAKFDLAPLQGHEVVLASLRYKVFGVTDTNAPQVFPNSCALSLWAATAPQVTIDTPGDLVLDGLPEETSFPHSVDVTNVVRDWMAGRRPNHGFFIDGQRDPPRDNNNYCESMLGVFALAVIVR